jgi:hypothetical protein
MDITNAPGTGTPVNIAGLSSTSIALALKGIVAPPLDAIINVTNSDAFFVPDGAQSNFPVQPLTSWSDRLQFATLEQAICIKALIEFQYPGSKLTIEDDDDFFTAPGARRLQYAAGNTGGLFDVRVYKITGTIALKEGQTPTEFNVGYNLNFKRNLQGGSTAMETGPGWPEGNSVLRAINEMGLAQPIWVGGDKQ